MVRLVALLVFLLIALFAFGDDLHRVEYYDIDHLYSDLTRTKLVNNELTSLLETVPNVTQVRIGLIHQRRDPRDDLPEYLFDVAFVKTKANYTPALTVTNVPLTQWRDYLVDLVDNRCPFVEVQKMQDAGVKERLAKVKANSFLGCPLLDAHGYLIGAVFVLWTENAYPINIEQDKLTLRTVSKRIEKELAAK